MKGKPRMQIDKPSMGAGGFCVCLKCEEKIPKKADITGRGTKHPPCRIKMVRE
jgi:hypothetical protein